MTEPESGNLAPSLVLIREYLAAIASGMIADQMARFFTPDARQIELPNRLNPRGGESDPAAMQQRAEQGKRVVTGQTYTVISELAQGNRAAVEAVWTGVLLVPLGTLQAGATMTAHFAMFFEFENGRIRVQRNYDCFEPW